MSDGTSPGEIGGVVAAVLAILASIGAGIKWTATYLAGREVSRAAKLQAWHDELDKREGEFEEKQRQQQALIEARLRTVEASNFTLLRAVEMLSAALRVSDPDNPAIARVDALLNAAFPVDPNTPADMLRQAETIRQSRPPRRRQGGKAQ